MPKINIPDFTADDYLDGTAPFEWLYQYHDNTFQMRQLCTRMSAQAFEKAKIRNFTKLFSDYCKMLSKLSGNMLSGENMTAFTQQKISLWCGSWIADDTGITGIDHLGNSIEVLSHPLYPTKILTNIDTKLEKIELHWYRGNDKESFHIFPKSLIANASSIVKLADYGIAVNSENAKALVRYLSDLENLNYDRLERSYSIGRLGWIEGYGFSPYIDNLVYDGDDTYADRFASVQAHGNYDKWMQAIKSIRAKENPIIRIVFAASLASCLVKPAGIMPFIVHLWGRGGSGKSVTMMVAATIWGNPEIGKFPKSFNSTGVGKELGTVFLNSMPLMLDELQIVSGDKNKLRQTIYELTEGVGRERGRKEGGLQKTGTWRNVIITTGEQPLVEPSWTEGAKYRTIEINCSDIKFFESGNCIGKNAKEVVNFILNHYGFFGRDFVKRLQQEGFDYLHNLHDQYTEEIKVTCDIDSKQALSAALILVADTLTEKWFFMDGIRLTTQDIIPHLITRYDADQDRKAFEYLQEITSIYRTHFNPSLAEERNIDIWGEFKKKGKKDYAIFFPSRFNQLLEDKGYNVGKFIEWARLNGVLRIGRDGKTTITTRITGMDKPQRCFWLLLPEYEVEDDEEEGNNIPDYIP